MLNHFTFNGHSTGELGLLVSGINIYGSPSRVVEKVNIPYRSGDLLIDTGAYTNYMLTYTVDIMDNTKATAEAISKWLLGSKGYCELTDTYNPEIYRVASYYNQLDYTLSALYRYGKATITFDCKPQKYLTANQPVSLSSTLSEETSYSLSTPAMPLPITLEGNTTQKTLSGKNLIPVTATTQTVNGVTFTVNEDGTVRANGTATASFSFNFFYRGSGIANGIPLTAGTTYVLSTADMQYFPINIQIMRNGQPIAVSSNSPFTAQDGDYVSLVWVWRQSGTVFNNALFSPQFEVGSTPTAYEPYCGGIPSPNPDYPQEIHSVKGDNEVRVVGKNLWDNEKAVADSNNSQTYIDGEWLRFQTGNNRLIYNVECEGTLTLQGIFKSGTTASTTIALDAFYTDGTSSTLIAINTTDTDEHFVSGTTTSGKNVSYIRSQWINTREAFAKNIQLELGSTATTYEPYKAQVYPINLGSIELNALGNYKDYFHKSDGKWYLHKAIGSQVGSTAPNSSGTASSGAYRYNYATVTRFKEYTEAQGGASSHFTYNINYNAPSGSFYNTGGNIIFFCDIAPADIGAWAQENKPIFYGVLATPTETEITDTTLISQLNALSKAKTYDGSTTIVQEGTDAQFKLSMPVPAEVTSEYKGEPIITVSEVGTIVWNDSLIKVNSAPVTINSQTLQCYYYSENKNNDVEINEFPKYEQGENYIGSTMALTVVPNYWKL